MGTSGLIRDWRYSGLSDADDDKNDVLKWRIADSFCQRKNVYYCYFHFQIFTIGSQRAFIFIYSQQTRYDQIGIYRCLQSCFNLLQLSKFLSSCESRKTHHTISVPQFLVERFLCRSLWRTLCYWVRPLARILFLLMTVSDVVRQQN